MMTEKGRFGAVSKEGVRHTIVEWQHWTEYRPLSGPPEKVPGAVELFTDNGYDVTPNADGTFTVLQTDAVLTRI